DDVIFSRDDLNNPLGVQNGYSLKASADCGPRALLIQVASSHDVLVERCSNTAPAIGTWHHVAGTNDPSALEMHIYVDGVLDDAALILGTPASSGTVPSTQYEPMSGVHVQIGNANPKSPSLTGGGNAVQGLIDDVRIYDHALSADEVAALAQ